MNLHMSPDSPTRDRDAIATTPDDGAAAHESRSLAVAVGEDEAAARGSPWLGGS